MKTCMRLSGAPQAQQPASSSFDICLRIVSDTYSDNSGHHLVVDVRLCLLLLFCRLGETKYSYFSSRKAQKPFSDAKRGSMSYPASQCDSPGDLKYAGDDNGLAHGEGTAAN